MTGPLTVIAVTGLATLAGTVIDERAGVNLNLNLGTVFSVLAIIVSGVWWLSRVHTRLSDSIDSLKQQVSDLPCDPVRRKDRAQREEQDRRQAASSRECPSAEEGD